MTGMAHGNLGQKNIYNEKKAGPPPFLPRNSRTSDIRHRVNAAAATAMKKILLATTLLSIVMCENILVENHPRSKELWVHNNQFWSKKRNQTPQNDLSSELEKILNRDDDKQLPRMLETRFISKSIIRRPDSTRFSQDDFLFPDKSTFNRINPAILISIGIQEEAKAGDNSKENCLTKKSHCKHNHNLQIQQPFYVEEPKWIALDPDSIDGTSRHFDNNDPYILSRGKKIFRLEDPEQVGKLIEDNEEVFDYPSRSKRLSTKSRAKRSVGTNENSRRSAADERDTRREKINHYGSFPTIDRGTKRKNENSYLVSDTNKRSTLLENKKFPEVYKKHRTHELNWMNAKSKEDVERNERNVRMMMEKIYDKLDDLRDAYNDSFILSRGKHTLDGRTESSNKNYASHEGATYEKPWRNAHLATSESKREKRNESSVLEIEKNITFEKIDSRLTHETAKISGETTDPNYREKRDACKSLVCKSGLQLPDHLLLKSFGEEIQDALSLERRDKTSEFLKKLTEPSFVISRGKKASKFKNDPYPMFQSRNIKVISPPIMSFLRMLLICNNSNDCDVDASKLASRRDRRGSFDEIFAEEEPFYVGRGKRMESDGFLTQPLQRENTISSETDAKQ